VTPGGRVMILPGPGQDDELPDDDMIVLEENLAAQIGMAVGPLVPLAHAHHVCRRGRVRTAPAGIRYRNGRRSLGRRRIAGLRSRMILRDRARRMPLET
jgi:hypothetical protein